MQGSLARLLPRPLQRRRSPGRPGKEGPTEDSLARAWGTWGGKPGGGGGFRVLWVLGLGHLMHEELIISFMTHTVKSSDFVKVCFLAVVLNKSVLALRDFTGMAEGLDRVLRAF